MGSVVMWRMGLSSLEAEASTEAPCSRSSLALLTIAQLPGIAAFLASNLEMQNYPFPSPGGALCPRKPDTVLGQKDFPRQWEGV